MVPCCPFPPTPFSHSLSLSACLFATGNEWESSQILIWLHIKGKTPTLLRQLTAAATKQGAHKAEKVRNARDEVAIKEAYIRIMTTARTTQNSRRRNKVTSVHVKKNKQRMDWSRYVEGTHGSFGSGGKESERTQLVWGKKKGGRQGRAGASDGVGCERERGRPKKKEVALFF